MPEDFMVVHSIGSFARVVGRSFLTRWFILALVLFSSTIRPSEGAALSGRPVVGPFLNGLLPNTAPQIAGSFDTVVAFPNLKFSHPMGLTYIPDSTKLVVWEREGRVWAFENDPATSEKTLVLDISDQCQGWGAAGLFSVTFHPGFQTNNLMFVYYTWVPPGTVVGDILTEPAEYSPGNYRDRLSRFTLDSNLATDSASELVLVDQITDSLFHSGGSIFFHPADGFLYWCNGDDYREPTQIIDQNLLSGVFRIDVDMQGGSISHPIPRQPLRGSTANYYIPNDNPFVGVANALEEFYALGLRSPYRMSVDPLTGRIFIGDVGEISREEIDVIDPNDPSGLNFQWKVVEGSGGSLTPPYLGVSKGPILDYGRYDGITVIGGFVYRGAEFSPELGGKYIFGDNYNNAIWALDESTIPPSKVSLATLPRGEGPATGLQYTGLSSFGTDANGEVYMCQLSTVNGRIYKFARLSPVPEARTFPKLLSETSAFADLATLQPSTNLIPYDVNSPLWSDGADKHRWFTIPTNSTIAFASSGEWTFPAGSVFVKHFQIPTDESDPAGSMRRLETRFIVRSENGGVFGATYKWRPDNSDADLLEAQLDETISIQTPTGIRTQVWHYPGTSECLQCHTVASSGVLGLNTRQLNRDLLYPGGIATNQLHAYNQAGLFYPSIPEGDISNLPRMVHITNTTASLEMRVRSYLDSNCSHCHRPGASRANWDGRFETPLVLSSILNGPVAQSFNIPGARTIVPDEIGKSIIHHRASSLDPAVRMPPLGKNVLDTEALAVLTEYINSLEPSEDSLPGGWQHLDIGPVGSPSTATFSANSLTLGVGMGNVYYEADFFSFVYQTLTGDGEISARVASISGQPWTRTGIMIRETLERGSRHAHIFVSFRQGVGLFSRSITSGSTSGPRWLGITPPMYIRLKRTGDLIEGYASTDGASWGMVGSVTLSLPDQVYIGFASVEEGAGQGNLVVDQIKTVNVPNLNQPPSVSLLAPGGDSTHSAGPIYLSASAEDADGYIPMIEFYNGSTKLGQATSSPFRLLVNTVPGTYNFSVKAFDNFGTIALSSTQSVEIDPLELTLGSPEELQEQFKFAFPANLGITYTAEASTNLIHWYPVSTNTPRAIPQVEVTVPYSDAAIFFRIRPR